MTHPLQSFCLAFLFLGRHWPEPMLFSTLCHHCGKFREDMAMCMCLYELLEFQISKFILFLLFVFCWMLYCLCCVILLLHKQLSFGDKKKF